MLSTLTKKWLRNSLLLSLTAVLFFSCQKDLAYEDGGGSTTPPDLVTKISSSVSGFVTDCTTKIHIIPILSILFI